MRHYYTVEQIRAAEAPLLASLPDGVLMRRAAFGLTTVILNELARRTGGITGRRVCAVAGSGDNGGDALWAATLLRRRGVAADAILLNPDRAHPAALAAFRKAGGRRVERVGEGTDLVIDGVVGLAAKGPLRPAAAEIFAAVDDSGIPVVAVDLPSGLDPHTGAADGPAVRAAVTVTFGGRKPVHALGDCGRVEVIDIGLDLPETDLLGIDAAEAAARWPVPRRADDKYTQGVTGILAGSAAYPGAAILCAGAAVAATAGMVRYAGSAAAEVVDHWPEVVIAPSAAAAGRVQAWAVGPGLGTDDAAAAALWFALDTDLPVIVDADALTMLAAHPELVTGRSAPTVLTPHAGEFARLAGEPPGADRVGAARALAERFGATVLLKGHVTVIAEPGGGSARLDGGEAKLGPPHRHGGSARLDGGEAKLGPAHRPGRVYLNPAGQSWAATAGSGDVLSGMIGALLAAGLPAAEAAAVAVFVHTRAAELAATESGRGAAPTSASPILAHIRPAVAELRTREHTH
ncbi:NAD(P)H-hydrate epimerase [Mycobacterium sp. 1274756.6]|uniref:NAD(P)H-hydrate epimerase n=1 Tax=Mycobacterium sp. 1274756.6 TaxID=1834076 RepID=UPI0007FE73EA|nr:NAD(P)H-hydrate epimerase [Mycobacterium sp. 1274756.6]OBJ72202.1 NAD(P)H-hydrate epimerase [Mycobacterium sp. 1274756.6]